jgi:putative DNA primase/helicase
MKIQRLRKIAHIEDRATGKVVERIRYRKSNFRQGHIELPPSVVRDPRALEKQLVDVGAVLPRDRKIIKHLLDQVADQKPETFQVYADRCGWTEDRQAYILPRTVIGSPVERIVGINPLGFANDSSGRRLEVGTWHGWRRKVAEPASQSSMLMTAIAFSLAAPFLSYLGHDSRTICIFGPSRSGKTTAALVAASVIGIGRTADLPTWNVTDARLEQQLALFNDSLFPIDDLGTIGGKAHEAYQRVRDLAYRLHQGWARARHSTFSAANNLVREQWRAIGLTSSEISIRDLAKSAGCERLPGECVRLIDVPVLLGGEDRLFDRARDITSRDASAAMLQNIINATAEQHGAAFRQHILNMIKADGRFNCKANAKRFTNAVRARGDGNLTRDVATTFGIAYAAGCFAIRCRLLPWTEADLLDALHTIYRGAREMLPDDGVLLRNGLRALRRALRELRRESVRIGSSVDFDSVNGFCKRTGNSRCYLIKGDTFNSIFATTRERTLVIQWLLQKHRLKTAGPPKSGDRRQIRPKDQIVWPDRKRRRSVEIVWPRRPKKQRVR